MKATKAKMEIKYIMHSKIDLLSEIDKMEMVEFLFEHLDQYGDKKTSIYKAVEYAVGDHPYKGGFVLLARADDKIVGAVVINHTHMGGYIPENILVYIAVHKEYRGKGLGKGLMMETIDRASGDIALHVEKDNPAKILYEKLGFTNPYLEMRLSRKK